MYGTQTYFISKDTLSSLADQNTSYISKRCSEWISMSNNFVKLINNAPIQEMFSRLDKAELFRQFAKIRKYDYHILAISWHKKIKIVIYDLVIFHLYWYNYILLIIGNTLIVAGGATAHVLQQIVYRNYPQKLDTDKNYFGHFPPSLQNFLSYVFNSSIIDVSNFKNKGCNFTSTYNPLSKLSRNFALQQLLNHHSQTTLSFWFKPSRYCIQFFSYFKIWKLHELFSEESYNLTNRKRWCSFYFFFRSNVFLLTLIWTSYNVDSNINFFQYSKKYSFGKLNVMIKTEIYFIDPLIDSSFSILERKVFSYLFIYKF